MWLLTEDESNVVRCSAVEGLGLMALEEASLRDEAEEMVARYLREEDDGYEEPCTDGDTDVGEGGA